MAELSEDQLRAVFDSVDESGSGRISLATLQSVLATVAGGAHTDISHLRDVSDDSISFETFASCVHELVAKHHGSGDSSGEDGAAGGAADGEDALANHSGSSSGSDGEDDTFDGVLSGSSHQPKALPLAAAAQAEELEADGEAVPSPSRQSSFSAGDGELGELGEEDDDAEAAPAAAAAHGGSNGNGAAGPSAQPGSGAVAQRAVAGSTPRRRSVPNTPNGRVVRRSSSLMSFSPTGDDRQAEVDSLTKQLNEANTRLLELEETHKELQNKYSLSQRRCADYETHIRDVDEQAKQSESNVSAMLNASIEKLRKEKEQDGLESKEALAQAEAALASSQAAAAALSSQLEEEKERAAAARQAVIDMETRLIDSEKQLVDLTAEMETKLQHERARTEQLLNAATLQHQAALEQSLSEAKEETEALIQRSHDEQVQFELQRQELEREIETQHKRVADLEAALADPAEFERQFMKRGLQMVQNKVNGSSLAAELNEASREELMDKVTKMADENSALKQYLDNLLAIVIDRIPDILEIKASSS